MTKNNLFLAVALLVIGGLIAGVAFHLDQSEATYKVSKDFVYGVGVGKYPKQAVSDRQAELLARRAAMDNAKYNILKAVWKENVETSFATVSQVEHSGGRLKIAGLVRMPEIVSEEVKNKKVVVELRIPIVVI